MPIRDLLVSMGRLKQAVFPERSCHQLHPDGQPCTIKTRRERYPRNACQVGRQGENILQVHGKRVVDVLADAESGVGRSRCSYQVDLIEDLLEVLFDEGAHFLRLPVIGIIITGRKCIGAQHDTALDLRAKQVAARCRNTSHIVSDG